MGAMCQRCLCCGYQKGRVECDGGKEHCERVMKFRAMEELHMWRAVENEIGELYGSGASSIVPISEVALDAYLARNTS